MQVQGAAAEDSVQKYFSDLAKIVARNGLKIQDKVFIEKHLLYGIKPDVVKDDIRNRFQAGRAEDRAARHNLALFRKMLLSMAKDTVRHHKLYGQQGRANKNGAGNDRKGRGGVRGRGLQHLPK